MKLDATAFAMVSGAHDRRRLRLKPDPLRGAAPPQAGLAVVRCTEAISTATTTKSSLIQRPRVGAFALRAKFRILLAASRLRRDYINCAVNPLVPRGRSVPLRGLKREWNLFSLTYLYIRNPLSLSALSQMTHCAKSPARRLLSMRYRPVCTMAHGGIPCPKESSLHRL